MLGADRIGSATCPAAICESAALARIVIREESPSSTPAALKPPRYRGARAVLKEEKAARRIHAFKRNSKG